MCINRRLAFFFEVESQGEAQAAIVSAWKSLNKLPLLAFHDRVIHACHRYPRLIFMLGIAMREGARARDAGNGVVGDLKFDVAPRKDSCIRSHFRRASMYSHAQEKSKRH